MTAVTAVRRASALALCALLLGAAGDAAACHDWPAWQRFTAAYVSDDGRVVDGASPERQTVSEGQAYALLFALVAGDRSGFRRLLTWTTNNLAAGDLDARLPAWRWGHRPDGAWGVLDANPAADADVWLAYALLEAGRHWREPAYTTAGRNLAARILREETATVPGLGRVLLPAPQGFVSTAGWRLNPSYMPLQALGRLARLTGDAAWDELARNAYQVIAATAPHGLAPDWALLAPSGAVGADPTGGTTGSWAAIRVYLWAATLSPLEPRRRPVLAALRPMATLVDQRGLPPQSVDAATGAASGEGPVGFSAALIAFLHAEGYGAAAESARRRALASARDTIDGGHSYYDAVLTLFGLGYAEHRYRFARGGALVLQDGAACAG